MVAQVHSRELSADFEPSKRRIRVLHIVENLDSQAVESWLLRVLRASLDNYPQVHWTFFCAVGREGRLDELARSLGADVIYSQHELGDKLRFIRSLREVMKRGSYDILHCHHDVMSAAYLLAAQGLPFRKRIVHVHNTSLSLPTPSRVKACVAREPMRQMCLRMADHIVGISKEALKSMVGDIVIDPTRHRVVHYAVDADQFSRAPVDQEGFRKSLALGADVKVLLFVGRMISYKNPSFVLEILKHLLGSRLRVAAVFAGAGDQEGEMLRLAKREGLEGRIRFLGFRDDVPELMANSDVLLWPSLEDPQEGLGLGIVEAQAAGLPILMSRSVPPEAIVVPELVDVLPLSLGAQAWADRVGEILDRQLTSREKAGARVKSSSFSMTEGVANVLSLYE